MEELATSLDELFMEMADLKVQNESLATLIQSRDKMNLLLAKHVERLAREKEVLLMHLGLKALEKVGSKPVEEMTLKEILEKLK
ncbi:hypothetical protein UFOVP49_164 [uncultured Caudovirales phage]|jgi:hypothetical protein|uniref:Uncharacterized protein n=1 Tax=uncultured Caudovirales phage TaxID=2100421 RepID=A0A6J5KSW2_9CAUD|nr:hypothetical protein UFOVP49_164 [uncultured Caudovirales phage]